MSINFSMSDGGVYGFTGFVKGITMEVRSNKYLSSVVEFTHATLSNAFDMWMDSVARAASEQYQHVYEWPTQFQNYDETVGNPAFRLWRHVLVGSGKSRNATFAFLPSVRPSPVNPTLTTPGDDGSFVKEGVHIFHWKAPAMEYGINIEVTPKIAKMLAYVDDRDETGDGNDAGWHHRKPKKGTDDTGHRIQFSEGPVHFQAGGGKFVGKFTSAFMFWWASMADDTFNMLVKPRLEEDLIPRDKMGRFIARGNMSGSDFGGKAKVFSMGAQASKNARLFHEAEEAAQRELQGKANNYIQEARVRRRMIYGY